VDSLTTATFMPVVSQTLRLDRGIVKTRILGSAMGQSIRCMSAPLERLMMMSMFEIFSQISTS
jgi:hypothetical protein